MYHVHGESGEELASGLYGALIVVDSGRTLDPPSDLLFVLADGGPGTTKPIFINGTATPDTIEMRVGSTYRLRSMFIQSDDHFMTTLSGPAGIVSTRWIAFDGHDQPADARPTRPLSYATGPGHTRDEVFSPTAPGDYILSAQRLVTGAVAMTIGPVTRVPMRVRAP
jgi:hypothetical protein